MKYILKKATLITALLIANGQSSEFLKEQKTTGSDSLQSTNLETQPNSFITEEQEYIKLSVEQSTPLIKISNEQATEILKKIFTKTATELCAELPTEQLAKLPAEILVKLPLETLKELSKTSDCIEKILGQFKIAIEKADKVIEEKEIEQIREEMIEENKKEIEKLEKELEKEIEKANKMIEESEKEIEKILESAESKEIIETTSKLK